MANRQKQGKSHKLNRSKRQVKKYERQYIRTAANKLRRINRQRKLANLPILKTLAFKDKAGKPFAVFA